MVSCCSCWSGSFRCIIRTNSTNTLHAFSSELYIAERKLCFKDILTSGVLCFLQKYTIMFEWWFSSSRFSCRTCPASRSSCSERFWRRNVSQRLTELVLKRLVCAFIHNSPDGHIATTRWILQDSTHRWTIVLCLSFSIHYYYRSGLKRSWETWTENHCTTGKSHQS